MLGGGPGFGGRLDGGPGAGGARGATSIRGAPSAATGSFSCCFPVQSRRSGRCSAQVEPGECSRPARSRVGDAGVGKWAPGRRRTVASLLRIREMYVSVESVVGKSAVGTGPSRKSTSPSRQFRPAIPSQVRSDIPAIRQFRPRFVPAFRQFGNSVPGSFDGLVRSMAWCGGDDVGAILLFACAGDLTGAQYFDTAQETVRRVERGPTVGHFRGPPVAGRLQFGLRPPGRIRSRS